MRPKFYLKRKYTVYNCASRNVPQRSKLQYCILVYLRYIPISSVPSVPTHMYSTHSTV